MDIPKYAKLENERRFLVYPARAPSVEGLPHRLIEDRYIDGARLRLRMAAHSVTGARDLKLCKKYGSDDPLSEPIVNIYLSAEEYAVLAVLPATVIVKRRYLVDGCGLNIFYGELSGLILCEKEAPSREAASALVMPDWVGREVTADGFFTGGQLSRVSASELRARL